MPESSRDAGQHRLRQHHDNNDSTADFVGFYPGYNATSSRRPQLVVTYY